MLFQVGPLTIAKRPFNVHEWSRDTSADWAKKDLLGRRPGRAFVGEGDETLTLKGRLYPTHRRHAGALSALELAHAMRRSGDPQFVTRGDGLVLGWYGVVGVKEDHSLIGPMSGGVGGQIAHELKLIPVDAPGAAAGADLLGSLLSLFG